MPTTKHHPMGCSKWTAMYHCGSFQSSEPGEAALLGHRIHERIEQRLKGEDCIIESDIADQVMYALEKVDLLVGKPEMIEETIEYHNEDWELEYFTTVDVAQGAQIIDFKTGEEHDYYYQMAGMALAYMTLRNISSVTCHLVYTKLRKVDTRVITIDEAKLVFDQVKANYNAKNTAMNGMCKYCDHFTTCDKSTSAIVSLQEGREDWTLDNYHSSQITDPKQMAKAYQLSKLVAKWADAVQYQVKDKLQQGMEIDGLDLAQRRGKKSINDLQALYGDLQKVISVEEFLQCCSLTSSKLEKLVVEKGMTKKEFTGILKEHQIEGKPFNIVKEIK